MKIRSAGPSRVRTAVHFAAALLLPALGAPLPIRAQAPSSVPPGVATDQPSGLGRE